MEVVPWRDRDGYGASFRSALCTYWLEQEIVRGLSMSDFRVVTTYGRHWNYARVFNNRSRITGHALVDRTRLKLRVVKYCDASSVVIYLNKFNLIYKESVGDCTRLRHPILGLPEDANEQQGNDPGITDSTETSSIGSKSSIEGGKAPQSHAALLRLSHNTATGDRQR